MDRLAPEDDVELTGIDGRGHLGDLQAGLLVHLTARRLFIGLVAFSAATGGEPPRPGRRVLWIHTPEQQRATLLVDEDDAGGATQPANDLHSSPPLRRFPACQTGPGAATSARPQLFTLPRRHGPRLAVSDCLATVDTAAVT